jgi:hypothetical protein
MSARAQAQTAVGGKVAPAALPAQSGLLQRKCACGGTPGLTGECEECSKKKPLGLQTKLRVGASGDTYEREADRIAQQVMAMPAHQGFLGSPPSIQRFAGQPTGPIERAPAVVDEALASSSRPLEAGLRQDMERRFGHDFSRVRVHADACANQAARAVHCHAFTAGDHIVFAAGRYAPQTTTGRNLLAHELTHVVQQSGAASAMPIQRQPAFGGENLAMRDHVNPEKWSEELEHQYRRRGDFERANAIRDCRLKGLPACTRILRPIDVRVLYVRDIIPGPASGSGRQTLKVGTRAPVSPGAAAAPAAAAGAAVALAPEFPPAPLPPAPAPPAPAPPAVDFTITPANENAIAEAAAEEAGIGGAEVVAGSTVIGAIIIVGGVQMFLQGRYEEKLRALGYILLDDPLGVCIQGCHLAQPAEPKWKDLEVPLTPIDQAPPPGQLRFRPGRVTTTITPSTPPVPEPRVKPDERRRRKRECPIAGGQKCPRWNPRLLRPNDYWRLALAHRAREGLLGREAFSQNIAVLMLDGEPPIVEKNDQSFHSEQLLLWKLLARGIKSDCPIIGLFSERKPCQDICQKDILPALCRINHGVPFDVYYVIEYYNSSEGIKTGNHRHELLAEYYGAYYL